MKIYNLTSLCQLPFHMLRPIFKVPSDKSVLMKCRNKQNWHKYCGSLEPRLGISSLESKSLKSCLNIESKSQIISCTTSLYVWLDSCQKLCTMENQTLLYIYAFTILHFPNLVTKVNDTLYKKLSFSSSVFIWKSIGSHLAPVLSILCTCV